MAPTLLFDISEIDLNQIVVSLDEIEKINPHRGHMRQLDGLAYFDLKKEEAIGVKYVKDDEFWIEGHIPGRPIYPGVLMIEAAAQLSSFIMKNIQPVSGFLGFLAVDDVKFRNQVVPGDTMYIVCKSVKISRRRFKCAAQGLVNGEFCFEAVVTGMSI